MARRYALGLSKYKLAHILYTIYVIMCIRGTAAGVSIDRGTYVHILLLLSLCLNKTFIYYYYCTRVCHIKPDSRTRTVVGT